MTTASFTGEVNTQGDFETVASVTSLTLTSGNTYNIQIQNTAILKVADAEFTFKNEKFNYVASSDDLYIKTEGAIPCVLTVLEV